MTEAPERTHMKIAGAAEGPVTVAAAIGALVRVKSFVGAQIAAVPKRSVAVRALVGSLS